MPERKSYIDEEGDALELDEAFFKAAVRGRPPLPEGTKKERVSIMLDPDVLSKLRTSGKGWQTRVNTLLRDALEL
ncbi:BrnA antitoxin family protein [Leisingera sp. F5]|uniref:BrnA antitoxin family protein n=1 Tax=Leisingera sp. F5 TaxID=1813816 RepID=UPI000ACD889D|nr:BrnA antitoxin family protein [Leisingera sp. F5]